MFEVPPAAGTDLPGRSVRCLLRAYLQRNDADASRAARIAGIVDAAPDNSG
jgi:hypothetical protein